MVKLHREMFLGEIGHAWRVEGDTVTGEIDAIPELCAPGSGRIRPAVLAACADVVAGILANRTIAPRIPLTVDLTFRWLAPVDGRVHMVARNLKVGRTTVVSETLFEGSESAESPVGVSHTTFIASPRPGDVMEEAHWERRMVPATISGPLAEQMGCVTVRPGVVELERSPYVMQPSGTIQGGAVALMAELAAESLLGQAIGSLEVRYLSAIRVGPGRATATRLSPTTARVEVRDPGNADRLATVALCQSVEVSAPAP